MPTLALLRHGQSQWNLENRFTGWVDVDLTAEGEAQAKRGGELLKAEGVAFDRAFASVLTRAIRTGNIALQAADQLWAPLTKDWRSERAPLWRADRARQGGDGCETRRKSGEGLAPVLRHPAAAARARW